MYHVLSTVLVNIELTIFFEFSHLHKASTTVELHINNIQKIARWISFSVQFYFVNVYIYIYRYFGKSCLSFLYSSRCHRSKWKWHISIVIINFFSVLNMPRDSFIYFLSIWYKNNIRSRSHCKKFIS